MVGVVVRLLALVLLLLLVVVVSGCGHVVVVVLHRGRRERGQHLGRGHVERPLDELLLLSEGVLLLEALPPPQEAAVLEHVVGVGVEGPVAALAGLLVIPGDLDEALVEAEVVPDGVLPALLVVPVVGEPVHDELVDAVERGLLVGRVLDGHGDERDVRVGRLHHVLLRGVRAGAVG